MGILGFKYLFDYFRAKRACIQLKASIVQYKQALLEQQGNVFTDFRATFRVILTYKKALVFPTPFYITLN